MRLLPCSRCRQPALATAAGLLHSAGQLLDSSIRYLCKRCGFPTVLSSAEFARLPEMTVQELEAASCDLPFPHPEDDRPPSPSSSS